MVTKEAAIVERACQENGGQVQAARDDAERENLWTARRAALPACARLRPTTVLEDATVPRSRIPAMLLVLERIARKYNVTIATYGHAGDGNLHPTITCDERDAAEMTRVHQAVDEIFHTAIELGGTLSGEHGIGVAKQKYMELEFGAGGVAVMQRVKQTLDPWGCSIPASWQDGPAAAAPAAAAAAPVPSASPITTCRCRSRPVKWQPSAPPAPVRWLPAARPAACSWKTASPRPACRRGSCTLSRYWNRPTPEARREVGCGWWDKSILLRIS